jgi:bifunctional non-homologous end joining protein LigD
MRPQLATLVDTVPAGDDWLHEIGTEGDNGIEIAGVKLTHPNRILYPGKNITKADLANYYAQVSEWILPHLEARPLTIVRCPEGTRKQCFYQRHGRQSLRPPIGKISVKENGKKVSYVAVDSLPGLIALVQMGVLEIHTWGSRQEQLERPDRVTFDLDPDPQLPWERIKEAALTLRSRLARFDLAAFVKTTGGKGLHVVVPLKPKRGWDEVKQFARNFAEALAAEAPELYTIQALKARRKGKIFLDYLRNSRTATAVAAYSSRAHENAPVSVPLRWRELSADLRGVHFNVANVPTRVAKLKQDPWSGYEQARRQLSDRLIR